MSVIRRSGLAALAAGLGVGLSACTVGPNYRVPDKALVNDPAAKRRFVAASSPGVTLEEPPAGWWRLYRDPALDALVERALDANTDLRVAEANLERSQGILTEVRATQQPDLVFNAGTNFTQRSAEAYLHAGPVPAKLLYDIGFSVSYEVDLFGRIRRGIEAAKAENEAVEATRDLVRVNVAAGTVRAYAEVCNSGNELATARHSLELQQKSAQLTRRLAEAGRSIRLEVTRQDTQVDQLRASIPMLEARQQNALFRLATLTGRPPSEFDAELTRCHEPLRLDQPLPVGDGAALLKRRPDIRAAERRLASSTAHIGVATAALYPSIQLGASIGSTGAALDFAIPETDRYSGGPGLSWRLNQSVPRARIAQANAEAKADLARFDGTVLTALREVESAINVYAHDLERVATLRNARDGAARVAEDAQTLQLSGRMGALAVLDAQRTLAAAEQSLAAAQTQVSADQVAVFLALGGGWDAGGKTVSASR